MPPYERHAKIFQLWDELKSGETLKIINDHDPKNFGSWSFIIFKVSPDFNSSHNWNILACLS
ncbi:MAG TPA: hypothetical protein DCQ99_05690, partial [Nitrospinae bacterium]|nr:hypothetical protein [Nitrospinota bacterium]